MSLFGHHDDPPRSERLSENFTGKGQRVRVAVVERDNGLVSATSQSISNALWDLADSRSLTHTVLLPHGTAVKLAAAPAPMGSHRARFEITNPVLKENKRVEAVGTSGAADLANQIDVLAMSKGDKDALAKVTEEWERGGRIQEAKVNVSGYVTRGGKHVGAYSQVRKLVASLKSGHSLRLPDGIKVSRKEAGFQVHDAGGNRHGGAALADPSSATTQALNASASSTHPKSIGGTKSHAKDVGFMGAKEIDAIPTDRRRADEARKRRQRDESPMPGVIRRPSESDEIRARGGKSQANDPKVGQRYRDQDGAIFDVVQVQGNGDAYVRPPHQKKGGILTKRALFDKWELVTKDSKRRGGAAVNIDREKRKRRKKLGEAAPPGFIGR